MPDSQLKVDRARDGVVLLTLDNPDQRNAMTGPMTDAWRRTTAELAADADLRAVVVAGAGSAFCSGGDMSWIGSEPEASVADLRERMLPFYRAWLSVLDLECPPSPRSTGRRSEPGCAWPWPATCASPPAMPASRRRSSAWGCTRRWQRRGCSPTSWVPHRRAT